MQLNNFLDRSIFPLEYYIFLETDFWDVRVVCDVLE